MGVILVAAGLGSRLGGGVPKQYRELGGVPMLLHSLRRFTAHPDVAHTVIALPPGDVAEPPPWLAERLGDTLAVVAGGPERSDSVARGLAALPAVCTTVLVHDAARPLIDHITIDGVIRVARTGEGAVPAVPLGDTLKESVESARDEAASGATPHILRTVSRDRLWCAQTPQGFPRAVLEEAHTRARQEGVRATDDAMLVERLGLPVRIVLGSSRNLKVTTEDDWRIAERLL